MNQISIDPIYYHGGFPGLKIGDQILCTEQLRQENRLQHPTLIETAQAVGHLKAVADSTKVYITTSLRAARVYAAVFPNGRLYRVQPIGEITTDPDCPEISFRCNSAIVVEIIQPLVLFKSKHLQTWLNELTLAVAHSVKG